MIKEFSLLLLIFLFLSIIYYFSSNTCNKQIESFVDKSGQKIFTLKERTFTYEKDKIVINPDYTFTTPLDKVVVSKLSDLKYNYSINDFKCIIEISYNDNPININVNDYSFTINFKKSKKIEDSLNIFIYDKVCGSIKNNILKTISPEIYDDVAIVGVIFLSYLIYHSIEDFYTKDYDKYYSSLSSSSSSKSITES
jgi:hypothetical protein